MSSARIGLIDVPLVYSQEMEYDLVSNEGRTATGEMLLDIDAVKRTWVLQTRPMLKADRDALIGYLESVFYGPVDFWLEEFGMDTVKAFITISESRDLSLPTRYSLTITAEEE